MRILYLADIRFPLERANGIQTMATCHALATRGHDVDLIVRPDTHEPPRDPYLFYDTPRLERLTIERAPLRGPALARRLGYLAFSLGRALGTGRPDVIFTRDLGVAAALLRLPAALRPPLVYESHGYAPDVTSALPDLIPSASRPSAAKLRRLAAREALVWREAAGYVTITHALLADLQERFGARSHLAVVPDGVRLSATGAPPRAGNEPSPARRRRPLVAYAGHLYAWKGVDILIEALAELPDADGLIVGGHPAEPDLARVQALAARAGVADRTTFTGHVDPGQVAASLAKASILSLPNPASAIATRFTSPLKLFEYMAAGRPIVASDLPALREILTPEVHAVMVTPGSAPALAAGIRRLLAEPAFAARLATAAQLAVQDYSWDRRAERLETLLSRILEGRE